MRPSLPHLLLLLTCVLAPLRATAAEPATAIFAGGCFWCIESDLEKVPGVIDVVSGYAGGPTPNPTYEQVSSGRSGHIEVVRVRYDASKLSYEKLVENFWTHIDPLDAQGQFCDKGPQYVSAIFVANPAERAVAEKTRDAAAKKLREPGLIVTQIRDAAPFYPAELYHQDYYRKNPLRYRLYRQGCGRDARLEQVWGTPK